MARLYPVGAIVGNQDRRGYVLSWKPILRSPTLEEANGKGPRIMLAIRNPPPRADAPYRVWYVMDRGETVHMASTRARAEGYLAGRIDRVLGYTSAYAASNVSSSNSYASEYSKGYREGHSGK